MCGIIGFIGTDGFNADQKIIERMTESIKHRGPDDKGIFIDGPVGFGFRRLSILDLTTAANQPMYSLDKRKVIVFNGEIFNYIELREELKSKGYHFRSTGDTEVVLNAYDRWGSECVKHFNGMWAFLIYDMNKRLIFGSRDRFGIKPLYCYRSDHFFTFASEIKAIIASGLYSGGINWGTSAKYLLKNLLDDNTHTFYQEIYSIAPGSSFELRMDGDYREWSYWSLETEHYKIKYPEEEFFDLFKDSVNVRLRSDVPLGVFLSGGMDSTSIICMMKELTSDATQTLGNNSLQSFCFMSKDFDETPYISATLDQTEAKLNELQCDPIEFWDDLPRLLSYHDEPVHSMTPIVSFKLFELARKNGIKVVLNGQGADETIAGYPSYFRNYWFSILEHMQFVKLFVEIQKFCKAHNGNQFKESAKLLDWFIRKRISNYGFYQNLRLMKEKKRIQDHTWFTAELKNYLVPENSNPEGNSLDAVLKYSLEKNPLPLYLRIEDRNSMAHSVEARLPFMDYRLISFLFNLPFNFKMKGKWNKYILRSAMKGHIPEIVRTRIDKMGFPTPSGKWFSDSLYEPARAIIESRDFIERGIYDSDRIKNDLDRHRRGEIDISSKIFAVLQFEIFLKSFGKIISDRSN